LPGSAREFFQEGLNFFNKGNTLRALTFFEKSYNVDPSEPLCRSYMALLLASERGQLQKGINLAEDTIAGSPKEPVLYLNLAKLYSRAERKKDAIETLRAGMRCGPVSESEALLNLLSRA